MMQFLHEFFTLNHEIIYFIYGLVFFVTGLAIALQSRNTSRLDLARSLQWLAAFGFAHGLNEWGDLFIPIQATYLSTATIKWLQYIHMLLLAVSFTFLFEFGVTLLKPLGRGRWLHSVSGALLAIWIFIVYFPLAAAVPDIDKWFNLSSALARYFIGFPGGLLAAYGLRQHTYQRIAPLNVPHIIKTLRFAGITMAFYAIFGGLIVPPIPFFPGNVLNMVTFEQAIGIPAVIFRSLIGLVLAIAIIRALEVFDLETERMIEAMEKQQILAAERERIARELHDGAIQKVYTAGLLVESAYHLLDSENPVLSNRLEKAQAVLNDAIGDLRHNLGELHLQPEGGNTAQTLEAGILKLANDPRFQSLVDIHTDIRLSEKEPFSPERAEHVMAIINEALSNVVRHSRSRHVKIQAEKQDGHLKLSVEDDGVGIPQEHTDGYGLRNMRDRARLLGGRVEISSVGHGTRILLDIPWKEGR